MAVAALAWFGLGLADRLAPSTLRVAGTESARGAELAAEHFGASEPLSILLRGPARAIDRQGPRLARELERREDARTLTPWSAEAEVEGLRPRPNAALVLADIPVPDGDTEALVERAEALVAATIEPPVDAQLTGYAPVAERLKRASLDATHRAELLAIPILLVVLLLVFRSPLAAAIPLLLGGATVLASRGLTAIGAEWVAIDGTAIAVASMVGLALGVDYSLLLVSRFREELAAGAPVPTAVSTSIATAGRTIFHAGVVLGLAMLAPLVLAPGALLTSLVAAVLIVVAVSVVNALLAGRALLLLLGTRIDLLAFGRADRGARLGGLLAGVLRRPLAPAALVLTLLLVLATPVTAFDSGPVNARQLPEGDPAREAAEAVADEVGPGWAAPFAVVVARERGPITDPPTMRELARWQRDVAAEPAVEAIVGPREVLAAAGEPFGAGEPFDIGEPFDADAPFAGLDGAALPPELSGAFAGLDELERGLAGAAAAIGGLRAGLERAAAGGDELAAGGREAALATERIEAGLVAAAQAAAAGSAALAELDAQGERALEGTGEASAGARELRRGLRRASGAALDLIDAAVVLRSGLRFNAGRLETAQPHVERGSEALREALEGLEEMTVGTTDPRYEEVLDAVRRAVGEVTGWDPVDDRPVNPFYGGAAREIGSAAENERRAARAAGRIAGGLRQLRQGLRRLTAGAARLVQGLGELEGGASELRGEGERAVSFAERLSAGLDQLGAGAGALRAGLERLGEEGGALGAQLADGAERARELEESFAGRGTDRLDGLADGLGLPADGLGLPADLLDSGYLFLAALATGEMAERSSVRGAIAVERGGRAARMIVVPAAAPTSEEVAGAIGDMSASAARLAERTGTTAALTGGAAELADYDRATSDRLLAIILAAALIAFLALVVILRALLLPLIAVVLNLLTVAAAFGVLAVLFQLSPGEPLGGPGYIDAVAAVAIFGLVFGLSIDYEVFLLGRMREGWLASRDPAGAIRYGLDRTAVVITGAAAIMIGVFCVFATAEVTTIRQFGIGLAVAIALDATLVRLVLLPALMQLGGRWTWWFPGTSTAAPADAPPAAPAAGQR